MTMNMIIGCRMCFDKFKMGELSKTLMLCKNCECIPISQTFKQCKYCHSDYKNTIDGDVCGKCKSQIQRHGDPTSCTICDLQMAFGNEVICIRCSHYRSKFGDAKQCENCKQFSAFYKDKSSRDKVDGKLLCWLCTYFYKLHKAKAYKASKRRADISKNLSSNDLSGMTRNDSSNNLIATETPLKKSRLEESSFPLYSNDAAYNEQLVKVNQLQEDVKEMRRKISIKETELLNKDNLITGLKADLIQQEKDFTNRQIVLKGRWDQEKESLLEKLKTMQRENSRLIKIKKKKRTVVSGYDCLTKDPLTMVPISNSPKVFTNSPKPPEKTSYSKLSVDFDEIADLKSSLLDDKSSNGDTKIKTVNTNETKTDDLSKTQTNDDEKDDTFPESPVLSLNSNSKDSSSAEVSPIVT